jgi:RNA polymerase sigma-70 factor (ECF subfamily)
MHEMSGCAAAHSGCAAARFDRSASVRRERRPGAAQRATDSGDCGDCGDCGDSGDSADTEDLRRFAVVLARKLARGQFDPEDLAHEALERWLRAAPREAPVASPRAWVAVVLRRLLVDRLRRRQAAAEVPADGMALAVVEPDPAPWWREIELGAVRRELGRLPPALRETFELFSFQARSYQQIAYQLNIATGTVGTRISRARALLRRRLSDHRPAGGASVATAGVAASAAASASATPAAALGGVRISRGGSRSEAAGELASR